MRLRQQLANACPKFDDTDGCVIAVPAAAATIREAFDAAMDCYGLPDGISGL